MPIYMRRSLRVLLMLSLAALIALSAACGAEDAAEDGDSFKDPAKGGAPQLTVPENHNSGQAWGRTECGLCHVGSQLADAHAFSPDFADSFAKIGEDGLGYGFCLYCHGTNGIEGVTADDYECLPCHADSAVVNTAAMFDGANGHDVDGSGSFADGDCVTCHAFSDMDGTFDVTVDLSPSALGYADTTDFCLTCHDASGAFGATPANVYDSYMTTGIHGMGSGDGAGFGELRGDHATGTAVDCETCHAVHTSDNVYLLPETGAGMIDNDTTAAGASISVTDEDMTQFCAVCHQTSGGPATENGLTGIVHLSPYSTTCTDCHNHSGNGLF